MIGLRTGYFCHHQWRSTSGHIPYPSYHVVVRKLPQSIPPPTLAHDLGGALGSMEHADVKFLAGGKPIYAHRSVLACQSEYFAAMFRFRCA